MHCALHPSDSALGVCAPCLRERLTDLLHLERNRSHVPFSAPLSLPSPTEPDRIHRTQSVVAQDKNNGSTAQSLQFCDQKPLGWKFPDKMHEVGGSNSNPPATEKKGNGEERKKSSAAPWWIAALLPRRHRKKSHMSAPAPAVAAAAAHASKNLSFLSATSFVDERTGKDEDFVGRDEVFHQQLKNSGPVNFEFEDYFSDSDLTKRSGGRGGKANARFFSRRKVKNSTDRDCRAANSSTTARVNIFSESEDEDSSRASPHVNPTGNYKRYSSGVFPSPSSKAKGLGGAGQSKYNHPDCAGSFSPYTDRKFQSSKPFSMAARREDAGFAFCPSPRKFFSHEISRSPRRGGKLSNFFFSPARRTT